MLRQVLVRTALGVGTLLVVSALLFFGTDALPGDTATALLGRNATPETLAATRDRLGLNEPIAERYVDWLAGFASGDLGASSISGRPVWDDIGPLVGNTVILAVATIVLLVPLSILFGVLSAILHDRFLDHATAGVTLALISVPEFVVGSLLVLVFAIWLPLVPAVSIFDPAKSLLGQPEFLVLPVLTLLAAAVAQTIRMVRATVLDILHSDFVEMARMKGVPEWRVIAGHALPNSMAPTIQVIVLNIAWLLGGVVIVEAVFQYPGIGAAMVRSVASRDLPMVQAIGMMITGSFIVLNLLADLIVILLNPRLRDRNGMSIAPEVTVAVEPAIAGTRARPLAVLIRAWRTPGAKIGLVLVVVVTLVAFVGPLVTPYSTTDTVARPFQGPTGEHWFGTDFLGRDAFSRFLDGGLTIVVLSTLATALAYAIGVPLGMFAGFRRSWPDLVTLGIVDVLLAFPALVLLLLLLALAGSELWIVVVGIAAAHVPRIVRVLRAVTIDIVQQEYVESAVSRGESTAAILRRELLPNLWTPIVADAGIRLTGSFLIAASLGFLGIGLSAPEANWGVMISENRLGLNLNPLVVVMPAVAIALFAVGINLFADAAARALGRSVMTRGV